MEENKYIKQRRARKKQYLRLRLGISHMIHKPLLNILLVPIIVFTVFIWVKKDMVLEMFEVPQILSPIYKYTINILTLLLPFILLVTLIEAIGNIIARIDESDLQEAFNNQELRNGCPILMNKKRIKGSNVIMREFYSNIPMKTWIEKQEDIADAMNCHFVEKLRYGGKADGKRIVMVTVKGRKRAQRGKLYDDDL